MNLKTKNKKELTKEYIQRCQSLKMTEISADKKPEIDGIITVPTPAANGAETANAVSVSLRPKPACFPNAVRAMEG